ncbi:MAG: L-lysine 2,3-aminomutase [Hyphomicrobiaceae bacterium hypho_1]
MENLITLKDLKKAGLINVKDMKALRPVAENYAIAITPYMRTRIDPTDKNDPIRQQFVPHISETYHLDEELADPIGDKIHSPVLGIVHRYKNRAILKVVNLCAVYCRFCFRRETVGHEKGGVLDIKTLTRALAYIANTPQLTEIILTGGDPFILSPEQIKNLTIQLTNIPHIKNIRWHTRIPIVKPECVSQELVKALKFTDCKVRVAIHANHANEFSNQTRTACQKLRKVGIELLSQSVLLRGINDDVQTLIDLFHAYESIDAAPYYLHHCDLARGTAHFRTTLAKGIQLMSILKQCLPSKQIPSYILDVPGGIGKVHISSKNVICLRQGLYNIRLKNGSLTTYRDRL